mmetsp:Transcript_1484/g.4957  ORF Transcript_1484/g.4957 Transcript_1484/m.4957 type:complete len:262 (+) Transcript_1484:869-1654(+)
MTFSLAHSILAALAGLSAYRRNVPGDARSIARMRSRTVPSTSDVSNLGARVTIISTPMSSTPTSLMRRFSCLRLPATFPLTFVERIFGCVSMRWMTSTCGRSTESSRIFAGSVHVMSIPSTCGFRSMTFRRLTFGRRSRRSLRRSIRKSGSKNSTLGNRPTQSPTSISEMPTARHSESSSSVTRSTTRRGSRNRPRFPPSRTSDARCDALATPHDSQNASSARFCDAVSFTPPPGADCASTSTSSITSVTRSNSASASCSS